MEAWEGRNSSATTWSVLDVLRTVATEHDASLSQVALAWILARRHVCAVVLGVRTVTQLADNLVASELELTADDLDSLDRVSEPHPDDYPYGVAGVAQ